MPAQTCYVIKVVNMADLAPEVKQLIHEFSSAIEDTRKRRHARMGERCCGWSTRSCLGGVESLKRVKLRSLAIRGTCRFDPQQQTSSRYTFRSVRCH